MALGNTFLPRYASSQSFIGIRLLTNVFKYRMVVRNKLLLGWFWYYLLWQPVSLGFRIYPTYFETSFMRNAFTASYEQEKAEKCIEIIVKCCIFLMGLYMIKA